MFSFSRERLDFNNRWRGREFVAHLYNGILLSHEKECSWVMCRDLGGPRVSYRVN